MADSTIELKPLLKDSKGIRIAIWVFTVVVFGLVLCLPALREALAIENPPAFTKALPGLNASINSICFLVLIISFVMIKKKNINAHMRLNTFAMILSIMFLLSYVFYHITNPDTPYEGEYGFIYYPILLTHIVTSAISLPFILFAYYRAFTGDVVKHRKIVKWAYPVWLYVAITGPTVYLFLSSYYNA
jgi:putative membrane protein